MKENIYVDVLLDSDPRLRAVSSPVTLPLSEEDKNILEDLLKYVEDSRDEQLAETYNLQAASGMAAPQIGINKQLLVVSIEEEIDEEIIVQRYALANPKIISHSVQQAYLQAGEGCLSVASPHQGYVPRYARITVEAYDLITDQMLKMRVSGYLAIVLQHEIDHLKGILFYDHINKDNPFQEIADAIIIE